MTTTAEILPGGRYSHVRIPALPADVDVMTAALQYVAGGLYVGPLAQGNKSPGSVLGKGWPSQTFSTPQEVAATFAGTDHGVFGHMGRADLVALDVDNPARVPEEWWPFMAAAPFQSTREQDGRRGHYVFACPPGRMLGNAIGTSRKGWGEVRGCNGVIVLSPTRHEKAAEGGRYQWIRTGPVPYLPDVIANTLPDGKPGDTALSDAELVAWLDKHTDTHPHGVRFREAASLKFHQWTQEEGGSRHDAAVRAARWMSREVAAGWYGSEAFGLLRDAFQGSFTRTERASGRGSTYEWQGILAWAVGQVTEEDVDFKRDDLERKRGVAFLAHYRAPDDKESSPVLDDDQTGEDAEAADQFRTGARGRDGRRRIHVGDQAAAAPWLRHEMGRNELAGLFMRGGQLVHTPRMGEAGYTPPKPKDPTLADKTSDGPAQIRPVADAGLTVMVETRYDVGTVKQSAAKATEENPEPAPVKRWNRSLLPKQLVTRMMGAAVQGEDVPNLRPLNAVTHTPTMRPDGTIHDQPGYDDVTGTLYLPTDQGQVLAVPEFPTADEVAAARELILYPVSQFPFVTDDDQANWVGMAFTPILRPMLPGPYQFGVIEAPSPGSGKGYLLGILGAAHGVAMRPGMPTRDEEWSKVIMTMLSSTTAPIVAFDNVRGVVHSAVLEGLLTSKVVADRTLGKNTESMTLPNDRFWCMTGNNAQLGGDLARRALRVTIDPQRENPEARTGFRCHPVQWVEEHRAEYIAALLTCARAWVTAGRPVRPVERSDDYAGWVQTLRGIMEHAGFPGTFSNSTTRKEVSTEDAEWSRFLEAVEDAMGGRDFTARELYGVISSPTMPEVQGRIPADLLPGDLAERFSFGQEAKLIKSLGLWLVNRVGRYAGGRVIRDKGRGTSGPRKNVAIYRIERADGSGAGHGEARGERFPFPRTAPNHAVRDDAETAW